MHTHVLLGVDDGWMMQSGLLQRLEDGSAMLRLCGIPMRAAEDFLSTEKQRRVAEEAGIGVRIISCVAGQAVYQSASCERKPSEYLGNLYVDTMGFSPTMMEQLLHVFGADRILFGSDYPAVPVSPAEHVAIVESLELSPPQKEAILYRNAKNLFKLGLA